MGTDQATGRSYYYNMSTGVSQWEVPQAIPMQIAPQPIPNQINQQVQMMQQIQNMSGLSNANQYQAQQSQQLSMQQGGYKIEQQFGGRNSSHRPFSDISSLPPDDQSKVRPEVAEWRKRNEITVSGDCPGETLL